MKVNDKSSSANEKGRSSHSNSKSKQRSRSRSASTTTTTTASSSPERPSRSGKVKSGKRSRDSRSRSSPHAGKRHRRHHSRHRSRSRSDRRRTSSNGTHSYGSQYIPPSTFPFDDPPPSKCLGVFGLSTSTDERTLDKLFSKFGHVDKIQIIYNKLTKISRGFGFIYYDRQRDATKARDSCQGISIDGYRIRVDYSVTERAHPPTPGVYMGSRRREHSPPRKYRRSRSYSPRRY